MEVPVLERKIINPQIYERVAQIVIQERERGLPILGEAVWLRLKMPEDVEGNIVIGATIQPGRENIAIQRTSITIGSSAHNISITFSPEELQPVDELTTDFLHTLEQYPRHDHLSCLARHRKRRMKANKVNRLVVPVPPAVFKSEEDLVEDYYEQKYAAGE